MLVLKNEEKYRCSITKEMKNEILRDGGVQ